MELPFFDGVDHFFLKHEILDVGGRDDNALLSGDAFFFAHFKKADLLIDIADGLYPSFLVDRSGHRNALLDGHIR